MLGLYQCISAGVLWCCI